MIVLYCGMCLNYYIAFEEEKKRLTELLEEVRVDAEVKVVGIPAVSLDGYRDREDFCKPEILKSFVALYNIPVDVLASVVNPVLKDVCPNSQMILMKLPIKMEECDAVKYMNSIREIVKDLPPILLMNSSTHLPVITRYI